MTEIPEPMTDEAREDYIRHCATQMELATARYEASGCFGDNGEAHRWRRQMEEAIGQRSSAQIARMQEEQAARMALEPGAERGV